ncbi:hypothetical protein, partial [Methanoregula sp.]|uniref:hypothetical protein n=1 Tax=Methanoregula sp. TaxID=2052170 RepID=UPI003FD81754
MIPLQTPIISGVINGSSRSCSFHRQDVTIDPDESVRGSPYLFLYLLPDDIIFFLRFSPGAGVSFCYYSHINREYNSTPFHPSPPKIP